MPKSLINHFTILNKFLRPLVRQILLDINTPDNYLFLSILVLSKYRVKATAEEVCTLLHGDKNSLHTMKCHGMHLLKLYAFLALTMSAVGSCCRAELLGLLTVIKCESCGHDVA